MVNRVPNRSCGVKGRSNAGPQGRPLDIEDRDIVEAILTEVDWEEEGLPDMDLSGWWSDRWGSPIGQPDRE